MKFVITRSEVVEVVDDEGQPLSEVNRDDLQDSLQDDLLNSQGSTHQTDDGKFNYIPLELAGLVVEPLAAPTTDAPTPTQDPAA